MLISLRALIWTIASVWNAFAQALHALTQIILLGLTQMHLQPETSLFSPKWDTSFHVK